jgi:cell division protein FtsZ
VAIEDALNSPLLNDNDIRGAKWILININSAEGEHEFTMDEVEVIQSYLLSQAGEGSDVIMGLGYDNTLGAEISITLIATGFEYKDPFAKTINQPIETKQKDKIVMTLDMPEPVRESIKVQQPTLQFELTPEPAAAIAPATTEPEKTVSTLIMPQPDETTKLPTPEQQSVEMKALVPEKPAVDIQAAAPVFFEISSAADQAPVILFDIPEPPKPAVKEQPADQHNIAAKQQEASTPVSSTGGYLAKPQRIYVQEPKPTPESNTTEELPLLQSTVQADEPVFEMQMVVKENHQAAEEKPIVQPQTYQPLSMSNVEDPALQDETEELRRRANDRIAKLRNLSFNINAADPNNEFEAVPAYLRRNMELHNSIADVESFYSKYTVKSDENNQAEISTINTFLDGKKPD